MKGSSQLDEAPGPLAADYSTAMKAAGHGKFQYAVFASAAMIYFSSGLQSAMNGYLLPSVKCEFDLSSSQMGMLNSAFLAGGVLTGQVWGALSDSLGRRPVLVASALLDTLFTIGAVLSPTFPIFFTFRLLSGMMNTAPAGLSFLYLGEFISDKKRRPFMVVLGACWTTSWTLLPAVAWLVIPQPWVLWLPGLRLGSWRLFLLMLLVPNLCSAAMAFHFPETPKFLQAAGREEAALAVYRRIFAANTGVAAEKYPVHHLKMSPSTHASPESNNVFRVIVEALKSCLDLLQPPVLSRTLICTLLYFCNMFMLYGFGFWLPELLNRFELYGSQYPESRATVCEVFSHQDSRQSRAIEVFTDDCASKTSINPSVFLYTLIVNAGSVCVNLSGSMGARFLGRRTMCAVFCAASGLAAIGLLFASSIVELVVVCTVFVGLAETGCITINALIVDIFPPRLSGAGVACVMLCGRLGGAVANVIIGYLLDVSCEVPLSLLIVLGILSGGLVCFAHRPYGDRSDNDQEGLTSSPAA